MKKSYPILFFSLLLYGTLFSQKNKIDIKALLIPEFDQLAIQQKITYYNNSKDELDKIILYNWPNSFKNRKTELSKRLVEAHKKDFYFADSIDKGYTQIRKLSVNYKPANYKEYDNKPDLLEISLEEKLSPKDSTIITINYQVKLPSSRFTGYGKNNQDYNLRYWYLSPVNYDGKWNCYSNININHIYMDPADYNMNIHVPIGYHINTALDSKIDYKGHLAQFQLTGKNRVDIQLFITKHSSYQSYKLKNLEIVSNLDSKHLQTSLKKDIIKREIDFIETHLGQYPHSKILVDQMTYQHNKAYGLDVIPDYLTIFPEVYRWDIKFFNTLCKQYIDQTLLFNKNKDYWLADGLHTYLLMKYTSKYYPDAKLFGRISKIWGVRKFNFSQMNFNDKYPLLYQFAARKNIDQRLTTSIDSLSNFNRKLIKNHKAGLGLRYLDEYLGDSILQSSLQEYYQKFNLKNAYSEDFQKLLANKTDKNLSWFFGDYVNSKKKIDYTLKRIKRSKDSIYITIKNKRKINAPVALYGVKNKKIRWKKWVSDIDSTKTIVVPKGDFNKVSLNYEYLYPEFNLRDNWKNVKPKLFERPLQFKLIKDISNPYYNQIFYKPSFDYNLYDGAILGIGFTNKPFLKNNFEFSITPNYSTKSQTSSGKFSILYNYLPEKGSVYRWRFGASGSNFHYEEDLRYTTFTPSLIIDFNRKTLRTTEVNQLSFKYLIIDKEIREDQITSPEDHYKIFKIGYTYNHPKLIHDVRFRAGVEFANNFNKINTEIRYRKLSDHNRFYDFRLFTGLFISNNTNSNSNYFSFGLSRPQDYLFEYNLFGRSEEEGVLSQQFVQAQGGFKSFFEKDHQKYANRWMTSLNTSIGLWKSLEIYNDAALLKSKNHPVFFAYESGFRLNFINNFFEIYLPIRSNLGWEITRNNYKSKIRFTMVLDITQTFNLITRGFL